MSDQKVTVEHLLLLAKHLRGPCEIYKADLENAAHELSVANAAREELERDKERLDKLDTLTRDYGNGWILRDSTTGRGMRLHETSAEGAHKTVREAIDAYVRTTFDITLAAMTGKEGD